jgi:hypothetical protein
MRVRHTYQSAYGRRLSRSRTHSSARWLWTTDIGPSRGWPGHSAACTASASAAPYAALLTAWFHQEWILAVPARVDPGGSSKSGSWLFQQEWILAVPAVQRAAPDASHSVGHRARPSARAVELVFVATAPGSVGKLLHGVRLLAMHFIGACGRRTPPSEALLRTKAEFQAARGEFQAPWQTRLEMIRPFTPFTPWRPFTPFTPWRPFTPNRHVVEGGAATRSVLKSRAFATSRHDGGVYAGERRSPESDSLPGRAARGERD